MSRPNLQHLQVDGLIAAAGGDPWAIDDSLQASSPTQIDFLAQAFYQAGESTTVAGATFRIAREHFQKYQREDGGQPINDGAEVARVRDGLHASKEQLGQIAADLEIIAASLAEARHTTAEDITTLNFNLQEYDAQIGVYLTEEEVGNNRDAEIKEVSDRAVTDTANTLHNVKATRADYSRRLRQALHRLRTDDGYDPDLDPDPDPDQNVNKNDADTPHPGGDGGAGAAGGTPGIPATGGSKNGADGGAGGSEGIPSAPTSPAAGGDAGIRSPLPPWLSRPVTPGPSQPGKAGTRTQAPQ